MGSQFPGLLRQWTYKIGGYMRDFNSWNYIYLREAINFMSDFDDTGKNEINIGGIGMICDGYCPIEKYLGPSYKLGR